MRSAIVGIVLVSVILAPTQTFAQHGRGGFGGGWGGGGGGGFGGGRGGGYGGGYGGGGGGASRAGGAPAGGGARAVNNPRPGAAAPRGPAANHLAGYSNRPMYHGGWYHGDWGGHWGGPWGYRPWGWGWYGGYGLGYGFGYGLGWGLGVGVAGIGFGLASPWSWGYYNYYNPYWSPVVGMPAYINYSQPVVVTPPPVTAQPASQYAQPGPQYGQPAPQFGQAPPQYPQPSPPGGAPPGGISSGGPAPAPQLSSAEEQGLALFDNARRLFQMGDYRDALAQTDRALGFTPNDSLMHEFRALCLFAQQDYKPAAAAVYAVVSAGPGWDWTTVSNLYSNVAVYSGQLRALESYCEKNTKAADARFLLAYHYMLGGHNAEATELLQEVVKLQPDDQLSVQLLKGLTTPANQSPEPAAPAAPAAPVDAASLVGVWRANRPDGSKFEMNLTAANKFTWKFTQRDKEQNISGSYTLANNFLILSANDQNALVGQIAMQPGNKLKFKLTGGNPAEPGITFTR